VTGITSSENRFYLKKEDKNWGDEKTIKEEKTYNTYKGKKIW